MPIDERQLGGHPLKGGSTILNDEACPKCNYNLKGLRRGGVCPECGRGISARKKDNRPRMFDAPRGYLARTALVFFLMGWSGMALFALAALPMVVFSLPILRYTVLADTLRAVAIITAFASTVIWAVGAIVISRPRPGFTDEYPEDRKWVPYIQFSQPIWPIALALGGVSMILASTPLAYLAYIGVVIAGLGLAPTAHRIAEYAEWGDDLNLGIQFRTAGLMIAGGVIMDVVYRLAVLIDFMGLIVVLMLWIIGLVVLTIGLFLLSWRCLQLAGEVRWAILNAKDADARAARIAEKAEQVKQDQDRKIAAQQQALNATAQSDTDHDDLLVPLEPNGSRPIENDRVDPEPGDENDALYRLEDN